MARIDIRLRNFKHCVRPKDSLSLHALSEKSADYTSSTSIHLGPRQRDSKASKKGSTLSSALYRGRVLQSSVSSPQKRGQYASSYRPKRLKSIHRKSPLPNGTPLKHKNTAQTRSIHDKNGSKGCLSVGCSSSRLPKVSALCLEKSDFPVQSSSLRSKHSTSGVHKIAKASSGSSEEKRRSPCDLPGRYPDNRFECERNTPVHRNGNDSTRIARLYNQPGQVDSQSYSGDNLFGVHHQFGQSDLVFAPRHRNQHSLTLSPNAGQAKSYSPSYSSDLGYSRICSSSDMEGPSPLSHASSAANTGITTKPRQLCKRGGPFGSIPARTALVGSEHHIMMAVL